jgi:hypothetical protein
MESKHQLLFTPVGTRCVAQTNPWPVELPSSPHAPLWCTESGGLSIVVQGWRACQRGVGLGGRVFALRLLSLVEGRNTKTVTLADRVTCLPLASITATSRLCSPRNTLVRAQLRLRWASPCGLPSISSCSVCAGASAGVMLALTEKFPGPRGMIVSSAGEVIATV